MVKKFERVWVDSQGYIRSIPVKHYTRAGYITDQRAYDFFDSESVTAFIHNVVNSILKEYSDEKQRKRLAFSISKRYFQKAEREENPVLKKSYLRIAKFFYKLYKHPSEKWIDILLS